MIEILVGLCVLKIIDKLFPSLRNRPEPTIFLMEFDNDNDQGDGENDTVEHYDWE